MNPRKTVLAFRRALVEIINSEILELPDPSAHEIDTFVRGRYDALAAALPGHVLGPLKIYRRGSVRHGRWTKDRVLASARRFKNKTEWCRKASGAANAARRMGWYDEATRHMESRIPQVITLEECQTEALKYQTRTAWAVGDRRTYNKAQRAGWADECTHHMSAPGTPLPEDDEGQADDDPYGMSSFDESARPGKAGVPEPPEAENRTGDTPDWL